MSNFKMIDPQRDWQRIKNELKWEFGVGLTNEQKEAKRSNETESLERLKTGLLVGGMIALPFAIAAGSFALKTAAVATAVIAVSPKIMP